jgi:hypothetical protein
MTRPVALDLCCGLGGWASGLIAAGWHVIGVDIENMFAALGEPMPPEHFELVLADICEINGADYAHVSLIVGSSPCQDFSYRAMPWRRAKALHAPFLGIFLFWQQFRIQREVCEAKGEFVPMVVENVRGAQPWVGRAAWNAGSMYFWGDIPGLMPQHKHVKVGSFRFDGSGGSFQSASVAQHVERRTAPGTDCRLTTVEPQEVRQRWFNDGPRTPDGLASSSSSSPRRKAASARIAMIPFEISSWIGRCYLPDPAPDARVGERPTDERLERRKS